MNYLRLINDGQIEKEFFSHDLPVQYLENIKGINIIIGANNTRKSRFIRKIISLDHKVIIKTSADLNKKIQEMESIFEDIDESLNNIKLVDFIFHQPQNQSLEYKSIYHFFSNGRNNQISFSDIRNTLRSLLETLKTASVADNIKGFVATADSAHKSFSLLLSIYQTIKPSYNYWTSQQPSNVEGITFKISEGFTGDQLDNKEKKIKILISVVEYIKIFTKIEFEFHHKNTMVYIPVLRTSRKLVGASNEVFKKTIQVQHKLEENSKLSIETGMDLYEKIEVARNGHRIERDRFAAFERFIGDVFFQSRPIDMIAIKGGTESDRHIKISIDGEQDDIAIHDLGDGIQAIINLLLPVFTARDESWIFIDEPENHLHPGYQNIFINAISKNDHIKRKKLKFFINTHSNHILTEALLGQENTEVFVFSRRDKDSSNILTFDGNEYNTLEMLGVFNTSVLISNCSIWVEGITDRLYLKGFLSAYYNSGKCTNTTFVEGLNYSYIEYAGNNLLHYTFDRKLRSENESNNENIKAFFINSNVFLLADSDFEKDLKHSFYKNLETQENLVYFQTELPEIENLIPESILKSWLVQDLNCNQEEVEDCFATKNQNEKLGHYFHEKFTYRTSKRKFTTPKIGGTLRSDLKQRLANFVFKGITNQTITWADLEESDIISSLVQKLYKFILQKNSKV